MQVTALSYDNDEMYARLYFIITSILKQDLGINMAQDKPYLAKRSNVFSNKKTMVILYL